MPSGSNVQLPCESTSDSTDPAGRAPFQAPGSIPKWRWGPVPAVWTRPIRSPLLTGWPTTTVSGYKCPYTDRKWSPVDVVCSTTTTDFDAGPHKRPTAITTPSAIATTGCPSPRCMSSPRWALNPLLK